MSPSCMSWGTACLCHTSFPVWRRERRLNWCRDWCRVARPSMSGAGLPTAIEMPVGVERGGVHSRRRPATAHPPPQVSAPGSPSSGMVLNFHTSLPSSRLNAPIQFFAPKSEPDGPMMARSSKISGGIENIVRLRARRSAGPQQLPVGIRARTNSRRRAPHEPAVLDGDAAIGGRDLLALRLPDVGPGSLQVVASSAKVEYRMVTYITPP